VAMGTRDLELPKKVFAINGQVIGENHFNTTERAIGKQWAAFVIDVEHALRKHGCDYPTAADIVRSEEEARICAAKPHPHFDLIGSANLMYDNFRRKKEIWNKWRDNDLDDSQWWCLCPRYRLRALMRHHKFIDATALTEDEIRSIRALILQTSRNEAGQCIPTALELYTRDRRCRPEVREAIQRVLDNPSASIPMSLRRAIVLPPEVLRAYRSKKRFRHGFTQIRGMFVFDRSTGAEIPLLPGDAFEADDMTVNTPWWVEWPYGGDPCSDKFGVRVGRGQLIAWRDIASGRWLGFTLIMRWKDSYRAVDIMQSCGRVFAAVGTPRRALRFERGIWESKKIEGVPLFKDDGTFDRRFGGLSELGFEIARTVSPKGKMIEQGFDPLQKVMGTFGVQVGRYRGEFEQATKDLTACQAGHKDPRHCAFLHINELVARLEQAFGYLNSKRIRGYQVKGVPDELWLRHVNNDAPLNPLPREKEWIFLPDYFERQVRAGCVLVDKQINGQDLTPLQFEVADFVAAGLCEGFRLIGFYDSAQPALGAWLFNNEDSTRNISNWPLGHFIGVAPYVNLAPQFCVGVGEHSPDTPARKRYCDAVRSAFVALGVFGRKAARTDEASDGNGNRVTLETPRIVSKDRSDCRPVSAMLPPGVEERCDIAREQIAARAKAAEQSNRIRKELNSRVSEEDKLRLLRGDTD